MPATEKCLLACDLCVSKSIALQKVTIKTDEFAEGDLPFLDGAISFCNKSPYRTTVDT